MKNRLLWRLTIAMLTLAALSFPHASQAAVKRYVDVQYLHVDGYTRGPKYLMQVTFLTGEEMNSAVGRYKYSPFDKLALVFWDDDQWSVLRMDCFVMVSEGFDADEFVSVFQYRSECKTTQLNGDSRRTYFLNAKRGWQWIDPAVVD